MLGVLLMFSGCPSNCDVNFKITNRLEGFARGFSSSVLLAFSQSYVEYDLRKNKIIVSFFCQYVNFYKLIFMF
jgi:hypothetical protein